jgi:hypothetical protein
MNTPTIQCPECHTEFALSETLAAEHIEAERALHRQAISELKKTYDSKQAEVTAREQQLAEQEARLQETVAAESERLQASIEESVRKEMHAKLAGAQQSLAEKDAQLEESEAKELASLKRMAEADAKLRQIELEVQRQLDKERAAIRGQTQKESGEELDRKVAEKDRVIEQLTGKIETLARQADSKSQQLQGDLEELNIYNRLQEHFPTDELTRTPRGRNGADILVKVKTASGRAAGTILIEVKDTQTFDRKWIDKLKADMHVQSADIGVIVSRTLPADISLFEQRDGIWICRPDVLVNLMAALRNEILHVNRVRSTAKLAETKQDVVFDYLTGSDFTRRVNMMLSGYTNMRTSLDKQKRQFNQRMAEQERALDQTITGLSGVYGDLSQLAGPALKPVEGLELDDFSENDPHVLENDEEISSVEHAEQPALKAS